MCCLHFPHTSSHQMELRHSTTHTTKMPQTCRGNVVLRGGAPPCRAINHSHNEDKDGVTQWRTAVLDICCWVHRTPAHRVEGASRLSLLGGRWEGQHCGPKETQIFHKQIGGLNCFLQSCEHSEIVQRHHQPKWPHTSQTPSSSQQESETPRPIRPNNLIQSPQSDVRVHKGHLIQWVWWVHWRLRRGTCGTRTAADCCLWCFVFVAGF